MKYLPLIFLAGGLCAQEQPNPKTLIPQTTIQGIVDEVSGTLAFQHILDLAGYEHDRLADEYQTTYREAAFIERMARQYGLEDVHIERFKIPNKTWDGELGELWLVEPEKRLLLTYRDVSAMLATGSKSGDVTSELVYVGRGDREADYAGKNVAGKIVLGSGSIGQMHTMAVRNHDAAGVLSFNDPTGKPIDRPDQIAWNGVGGRGGRGGGAAADGGRATWGINLSHRIGMELVSMIERGDKVVVRAIVKATEYDAEMQVPTAVIKGDGSSPQEIAITGHLFEGIAKQGALDDASGSAAALEVGRAWMKLIRDGVLPRPRRTVRFLWIPEIQGTRAYLQRYPEEAKNMVAAISMDMVGEDVSKNRNSLHLFRTPYSVNSFVNEVTQQFFEYVGDTNREKVQNRGIAYAYRYPILDPQGTRDQFYFNIEKHYGSSDHTVFLGMGIPAVLFNNWPDIAYHTSEDRPFNADPTQLKRALFIALASEHIMASADGPGAVRVAELTAGNAAERTGAELRLALQGVGEAGKSDVAAALHEALNRVHQAYWREGEAIRSAKVLAEKDEAAKTRIEAIAKNFVDTGEAADTSRVKNYSRQVAAADVDWKPSPTDDEAARTIPVLKPGAPAAGGPAPPLAGFYAQEARAFADGKRSVLEIRDAISAEFGPVDSSKVLAYFKGQSASFDLKTR
ncbi:MAG TPA: M28 family peptidase [Bryobacteraceae bacterium]